MIRPDRRLLFGVVGGRAFQACNDLRHNDVVQIDDTLGNRFVLPNYPAGSVIHPFHSTPATDTLRNSEGEFVFATPHDFDTFVKAQVLLPEGEQVLILRYDPSDQPQLVVDQKPLAVTRTLDQIRFVDDQYEFRAPMQGWTFWDSIPTTIDQTSLANDPLGYWHSLLIQRYAGRMCADTVSRHKLGWFLVYWMLNRSTVDAIRHVQQVNAGVAVDNNRLPGVALLNHAINILDLCIGTQPQTGPLVASGMFQPFLRGFLDEPTNWVLRKGTGDDRESLYLQLPDDPEDAMASILRSHPNTYLVRLSPSKAFHLDFVMYRVVDKEREKRQRRKYEEYVVVFSVNMLQPRVPMTPLPNCPAPMLALLYMMNHMHELHGLRDGYIPYFVPMSFLLLLDRLMRQKTFNNSKFPDTVAVAPVMANPGSARAYYASLCADPAWQSAYNKPPDLSRIATILDRQKELFDTVFAGLFEPGSLVDSANVVGLYRQYLETTQFCDPLFASMDNFGDPGCSVSSTWMIEHLPETPPNALMKQLYDYVLENFYSGALETKGNTFGCLWECERTVAGAVKEGVAWSESSENPLRRQHIWHLMRWLGMTFFVRALARPNDDWVIAVTSGLRHVLNASYAYPFASPDMAENMLSQLGPAARKRGFVLRLSTSIPLAWEQRTPNPNYRPSEPYMAEFNYKIIKSEEWINWLAGANDESLARINKMKWKVKTLLRDIAIKTPLHTDSELKLQLQEYLLRRGLYRDHDLVLVRNLRTIEQYLASCNVDVQARINIPFSTTRYAFRDASNADELERLDVVVEKAFPSDVKEWQDIKSKTLSVNARSEGQLLGLVSDTCRPGTYARLNFDQLHRPLCDDNPQWLFDQPLLTEAFLDQLVNKITKKQADDRKVARALVDTWELLIGAPAFANNWCTTGRRGHRNLSAAINWLSYDTVTFVAAHKTQLQNQTFVPKTPADWDNLLALNCLTELSADPVFHLLLTPPEADVLACTYPGFAIVSLSASTPHALLVSYVDPEAIFDIRHTEIDMTDLRPFYRPEFSLALLVRLLVFQLLRVHLAPAAQEVTRLDQAGCRKAEQARPEKSIYQAKFTTEVTNQYASQILSMLLSVAMDLDPNAVQQWYTERDQRWLQRHPWLALLNGMKVGAGKLFDFLNTLPDRAWKGFKTTLYNYNQWWVNPTHYWFGTDSVSGADFTEEILPLLQRFLDTSDRYAQQNFSPTDIPSLVKKIGATEEDDKPSGLVRDALRYREKEFQGEAYKTEKQTKAMEKEIKATIFGTLRDKYQKWREGASAKIPTAGATGTTTTAAAEAPLSTAPDTIYDALKFMQRLNRPAAAHRLLEKVQSGEPLGPGEIKIGITLGVLDARGQLLQRGLAPQFMPRVTESAGPLSEFQVSGPAFQQVKAQRWKPFNEQAPDENPTSFLAKLEEFESQEGCSDNGPDYVFPAFDVDSQGRILPRCGRPGWMSAAHTITKDQFDRLDETNQRLLLAIRNMAKHWCPTPAHELRLWRWIGISCLGKRSIDILTTLALDRLDDPTVATDTPIKQLSEQSRAEQRKLIQQFRERATRAKQSRQDPSDVCKKRVLFLQQMIASNILFPYLPDSKNARVLAGYNPDRVVVMLGWGKSGSVIAMRDGRKFLEHEYQAEDLVEYMQYVPTTVRLRIFHDFYGGICANNYDFYTRILHQSGQQKCLKSLSDMKRFAVRAALSMPDQRRLDEIYGQVVASGNITAEQRQMLEELQNISLLLQAKNLSTTELYVYEEIRKLENLPATDKQVPELAERLYKSKEVDVRMSEAEQFEALALCQRPEFVPYLRRKLKEKYPELSAAEIEAMDREHLCRVLINNPGLEQLKMPVLLWQIKSIPTEYRNPGQGGLLDIWTNNPSRQREINDWLMKNYGVTLKQIRDDNENTFTEETMQEQATRYQEEAEQRMTAETKRIEDLVVFREFLTNGAQCPYTVRLPGGQEEINLCEDTRRFVTTDGQELALGTDPGDDRKSLRALDLFSIVYANLCHPAVPLLMNDFEFILQSFNTLKNYFALRKYKAVPSERRLDKQCKVIQKMYNQLMDDARQASVAWLDFPLPDILKNKTIQDFYTRLRKGVEAKTPLRYAWSAFALKERTPEQHITFAFTVMLLVAELNGILTLQHT